MVLVTTAGEVGAEAALLLSRQDGTSRVTAGIDLSDIRGLDRVPELPLRPEHVPGEEPRERQPMSLTAHFEADRVGYTTHSYCTSFEERP